MEPFLISVKNEKLKKKLQNNNEIFCIILYARYAKIIKTTLYKNFESINNSFYQKKDPKDKVIY